MQIRILFVAVVSAVAALVLATGGQAATPKKLVGVAGPGFTITVSMNGKVVKSVKAGTYKLTVQDKSSSHNFHLFGAGFNKKTSVGEVKTTTWTVTLKKGKYTYQCDPHASSGMKGTLTVT